MNKRQARAEAYELITDWIDDRMDQEYYPWGCLSTDADAEKVREAIMAVHANLLTRATRLRAMDKRCASV